MDKTKDIVIRLKDDIKPFTLNFDVYKKTEVDKLDVSNPNLIFGGYILAEMDDKEFALRIYGQKVLGKPFWPPFNLILTQIKNKA